MSLTTVDDVALCWNRSVGDLTALELSQINALILYYDGVISNYCGWNMLATEYTDKRYNGSGTNELDLGIFPVNTLTEVKIRDTAGAFTDVTAGVEFLDDGKLRFLPWAETDLTTFSAGVKNIFISFNAGFADGAVPYELVKAATNAVVIELNRVVDESFGISEEKFGEVTIASTDLELPKVVTRNLDRYRIVSIV